MENRPINFIKAFFHKLLRFLRNGYILYFLLLSYRICSAQIVISKETFFFVFFCPIPCFKILSICDLHIIKIIIKFATIELN
ncbi:uncharacterized protein ASCRUDRAFT_107688 [Ascoidea rubescens DSM 1968]|uniref:Uncharacterized protein n=1 Tax=Ascoidea rubescens DSM 1968 TaxID=1344418 RepID=A0A1D2VDV7_9ASCO|nr:hypothetical protein ASCRUDRAFT_107688 [Ascoidea rubescens DSM 1968]ODV59874.1 hypothetical protein ASCRUDRAFT_107688 [Ascoidea rubescens DSM 1968]